MSQLSKRFAIAAAAAFISGASPIILTTIAPSMKGALMPAGVSLGLVCLAALLGGIAWRTRGVV